MIDPKAIDAFLNRQLDSFDWIKDENHARLDASLNALKPKPDFGKIKPWLHQKASFLILYAVKRFMFHIDMGGGKTAITLMLLKYLKQSGRKPKAIVFVPYLTAVGTWIDETALHAPDLKCVPLLGTTKQNLNTLHNAEGDLFVICYQSAVAMLSTPVPSQKRGKMRWQLLAPDVRKQFESFNVIVMDEIHNNKSADSLSYRMCRAISSQCEWAVGLTGTPFGKDPGDLWPEFYLIDFGETLGETYGLFREVFFRSKIGYSGFPEYQFKKRMLPQLNKIIKNCSISYPIEELHDLPPKNYIIQRINPIEGQRGYAQAAIQQINEAVAAKGREVYKIVESNYLQLRQLSSGFMTLRGADDSRVHVKFDENPKLDALLGLIADMPVGRKMVVFHHFVYTNKMLSEALTKHKIGHARVYSGVSDPLAEIKRFREDPLCEVGLINDKSGSSSLNLQFANYMVFFEQPDSPINRQQGERRVWRPGQKRRTFITDLFVRGTYDEAIYKANKAGETLLKRILK